MSTNQFEEVNEKVEAIAAFSKAIEKLDELKGTESFEDGVHQAKMMMLRAVANMAMRGAK